MEQGCATGVTRHSQKVYADAMFRLRLSLCCALVLMVRTVHALEEPTVDLFAGWSWWPYPWDYPYAWGPCAGVGYPIGFDRVYDPYLCGYPYGWGYGTHYRLWPNRKRLHPPDELYPMLPGAAPTELRSTEQKTVWDSELEAFLNTPAVVTNAPASNSAAGAHTTAPAAHSPNTYTTSN
jgi:hypothetical protein